MTGGQPRSLCFYVRVIAKKRLVQTVFGEFIQRSARIRFAWRIVGIPGHNIAEQKVEAGDGCLPGGGKGIDRARK